MGDNLAERIKELSGLVEQGVREAFSSGAYEEWLSLAAKFPTYSLSNQMLIYSQMPGASYVMGYKGWQGGFGRHVKKGEKGIAIFAPALKEAENAGGEKERQAAYFFPVHVFDVSQTDGPPLPNIAPELKQSVDGYPRFIEALKAASPFPIEFRPLEGGVRGYCDFGSEKIVINAGMSEAQAAKTAIHEITHVALHAPVQRLDAAKGRNAKEVEAESAAYIVCAHFGIDTSAYSFGYIASWSSGKGLGELKASMERIQKHSSDLIKRIEANIGYEALSTVGAPEGGAGKAPPSGSGKKSLNEALLEARARAAARAAKSTSNEAPQPPKVQAKSRSEGR